MIDITELKPMVQQLKTTKGKQNGVSKYGYEVIGDNLGNDIKNFIYDTEYYTVNRRRVEDKLF